jgi:predicted nucleic acid-binding protein
MIFVDTGAFLARYLANDAHHRRAVTTWKKVSGAPLFTSNHMIDETLTLLARQASYMFAVERAERMYGSAAVEILCSTRDDEMDAIRLLRKFGDHQVSFTDCISWVLMKRHRIRTAFTFDRHFRLAGLEVVGPSGTP